MRAQLLLATALSTPVVLAAPVAVLAQGPAPFDWTGFYVGQTMGLVQSGGSVNFDYPTSPASATDFTFNGNTFVLPTGGPGDTQTGLPTLFGLDRRGAVVGLDAGYNKQIGDFVFGLEGDFSAVGGGILHNSATSTQGDLTITSDATLQSLLSARVRAGVSVDRLLLFATAGLAAGQTSLSTDLSYSDSGKSASAAGAASGTSLGVIGGLGVEYALTDKISIKAEGLYFKLNGLSATATGSGQIDATDAGLEPYTVTYNPSGYIVRGGLNVHF